MASMASMRGSSGSGRRRDFLQLASPGAFEAILWATGVLKGKPGVLQDRRC